MDALELPGDFKAHHRRLYPARFLTCPPDRSTWPRGPGNWRLRTLAERTRQIIALIASIGTYQKAIDSLCTHLADYPLFAALPGAGPVFAPRLMAAFGTDRERYN